MPYFEDLFIKEAKKALEYHSDRGGGTVSGRNACHVVQDTPPKDPNVLWVDTTDNSDDGFQDVSYTKQEIDAIMGSYVTDIDNLLGGDG